MQPASLSSAWTPPPIDPGGSSVLVAAMSWLQQTMLGPLATTIAVIAVASVGLMVFSGRLNIRYGINVIVGCFIVFGASAIGSGIQSFSGRGEVGELARESLWTPAPTALPPPAPEDPAAADPYAGASAPAP